MKWFKHMCDSSEDEFLDGLKQEFGLVGYARWWIIMETVAAKMDKTGNDSVEYYWPKWESKLMGRRQQLRSYLLAIEELGGLQVVEKDNKLRISCPKLLNLCDNYLKKYVHKENFVSNQPEPEPEVEVEIDKNQPTRNSPQESEVDVFGEKNGLDLDGFFVFYENNDWHVGKDQSREPIENWQNLARAWSKRRKSKALDNVVSADFSSAVVEEPWHHNLGD